MSQPMRGRREQELDRQQSYDEYQAHVNKEAAVVFRRKPYQTVNVVEYLKKIRGDTVG